MSDQIVDMLASVQGRSISQERYAALLAAEQERNLLRADLVAAQAALAELHREFRDFAGGLIANVEHRDEINGKPVWDRLLIADGCFRVHDIRDVKALLATDPAARGRAIIEAAERMAAFLRDTARVERWDFANCGEHEPSGPVWIGPNDEHPADLAQVALDAWDRALGAAGGEGG